MRTLLARIEPYLTPLLAFSGSFFVAVIVLSLVVNSLIHDRPGLVVHHFVSLTAALLASAVCVFGLERGRWSLGIFVRPRRALRGMGRGLLFGAVLIGLSDLIIVALSQYRHVSGDGINWGLLTGLLLPAAFGEEVLFRGYVLQKLYVTNRGYAILITSVLFAVAHGGNPAVGPLAFTNILLAGVLLALMWAYDNSLWMPTWAHFAWNAISGPVLGHELSGIDLGDTLLGEIDPGPAWLTGGDFGIEASMILTVVEILAIGALGWRIRARGRALRDDAFATAEGFKDLPDRESSADSDQIEEVNSV